MSTNFSQLYLRISTNILILCEQFSASIDGNINEEFAKHCAVMFERRAENYLDMECLAMVGMLLFEHLIQAADGPV